MKKVILSAIMLVALAFSAQAQEISKNALGLRIGDNDGFGGEISYQRGLSKNNRLEVDLGFRNRSNYYGNDYDESGLKLTGVYQWVWNIEGGFNWYAGVGGGLANSSYDYNINGTRYEDSYTYLFAAGDIGIEYKFDGAPFMISLDFRPEFYFTDKVREDFGPDIALGLRFTF